MGKYSIIAETSAQLISMLQEALVPELIKNQSEIGLRSPADHSDVALGLYLYNVTESEEVRQQGRAILQNERISGIPIYLSLFYMITAYSAGDRRFRLDQEERILGKVIQTFWDHRIIPIEKIDPHSTHQMAPRIQLLRMTPDEKSRIWNFSSEENRLSLFYKVSPVSIESAYQEEIHRVQSVDIDVQNKDLGVG